MNNVLLNHTGVRSSVNTTSQTEAEMDGFQYDMLLAYLKQKYFFLSLLDSRKVCRFRICISCCLFFPVQAIFLGISRKSALIGMWKCTTFIAALVNSMLPHALQCWDTAGGHLRPSPSSASLGGQGQQPPCGVSSAFASAARTTRSLKCWGASSSEALSPNPQQHPEAQSV